MEAQENIIVETAETLDPARFDLAKKAAIEIGALIDGNGLSAEQVRIAREDPHLHRLPADMTVLIKPDLGESIQQGKIVVGETVASRADAIAKAEGAALAMLDDAAALKEIIALIYKKPAKSFGIDPARYPLSQVKKEYSSTDQCQQCMGACTQNCTLCNMTGAINCAFCHGAGTVMRDDGTQGACQTCAGTRTIPCTQCLGKGRLACLACNQSGYTTHIYTASWHIDVSFALDRALIPLDVQKIVDTLGLRAMAVEGHAEIAQQMPEKRDKAIIVPYFAYLPVNFAEFSLVGKNYPATIVGCHARIFAIDDFLDPLVKTGINALYKISKGPMAVAALMQTACKYRVARDVLSGLSHHSKRHVYNDIRAKYPIGLSDKYAKAAIKYASAALINLSRKPRQKGLVFGTILGCGVAAGYFLSPLRAVISALLDQQNLGRHILLSDIVFFSLCAATAFFSVKVFAARGLKKILPESVQSQRDHGLPAAGTEGLYGILAAFVVFILAAFLAGAQGPAWITSLQAVFAVKAG